jgi:hypothetical protein
MATTGQFVGIGDPDSAVVMLVIALHCKKNLIADVHLIDNPSLWGQFYLLEDRRPNAGRRIDGVAARGHVDSCNIVPDVPRLYTAATKQSAAGVVGHRSRIHITYSCECTRLVIRTVVLVFLCERRSHQHQTREKCNQNSSHIVSSAQMPTTVLIAS